MSQILIIDDSKSLTALIAASLLEQYQVSSVQAHSRAEAFASLDDSSKTIDLALVNIHLPDAPDGQLVDELLGRKIPTIVFTSDMNPKLRKSLLDKGVVDYALKGGSAHVSVVVDMIYRRLQNTSIKVLIVDDDKSARSLMAEYLGIQGFQIRQAAEGEQALAIMDEEPDISLVICDYVMDGMDGFELTQRLRERKSMSELIILGLSSDTQDSTAANFLRHGANMFFQKPINQDNFNCYLNSCANLLSQFQRLTHLNERYKNILNMAAHDLRTPLSTLIEGVKRVLKEQQSEKKKQESARIIHLASENIQDLITVLLDTAAIQYGKMNIEPVPTNLAEIAKHQLEFLEPKAEKKEIQLVLEAPDELNVIADPIRIGQVIGNLVSNAVKFSPATGMIKVVLKNQEQRVRLEVWDQGPGIDPDKLDELFGYFNRLNSKPTGGESSNGLGLAICKYLVEMHNGEVGYKRDSNKTQFYFTLPLD